MKVEIDGKEVAECWINVDLVVDGRRVEIQQHLGANGMDQVVFRIRGRRYVATAVARLAGWFQGERARPDEGFPLVGRRLRPGSQPVLGEDLVADAGEWSMFARWGLDSQALQNLVARPPGLSSEGESEGEPQCAPPQGVDAAEGGDSPPLPTADDFGPGFDFDDEQGQNGGPPEAGVPVAEPPAAPDPPDLEAALAAQDALAESLPAEDSTSRPFPVYLRPEHAHDSDVLSIGVASTPSEAFRVWSSVPPHRDGRNDIVGMVFNTAWWEPMYPGESPVQRAASSTRKASSGKGIKARKGGNAEGGSVRSTRARARRAAPKSSKKDPKGA